MSQLRIDHRTFRATIREVSSLEPGLNHRFLTATAPRHLSEPSLRAAIGLALGYELVSGSGCKPSSSLIASDVVESAGCT